MTCTAMSNLPSPESQISCPTIVWYCLIWSWSQSQICHSLGDLLPLEVSWSSLVFLQKFFHMIQVFFQHISLDLQQEFHLHLWCIHIQGDS